MAVGADDLLQDSTYGQLLRGLAVQFCIPAGANRTMPARRDSLTLGSCELACLVSSARPFSIRPISGATCIGLSAFHAFRTMAEIVR